MCTFQFRIPLPGGGRGEGPWGREGPWGVGGRGPRGGERKAGKTHSSVERRRDGLKQNPFIFEMAFMRCIARKKGKALGQSRKLKKFV